MDAVIAEDLDEHRYAMTSAISSGCIQFAGVLPDTSPAVILVAVGPGHTALTRILQGFNSSPSALVNPITAYLDVMYALLSGPPFVPHMEETFTITP